MPERAYGKRKCLQCGQTFEASHPAHITCSAKCAAERRRGQKRQTGARTRAKRKKYLLDLLTSLNEAWTELGSGSTAGMRPDAEKQKRLRWPCAPHMPWRRRS